MNENLQNPEVIAATLPSDTALLLGLLADKPAEEAKVHLGLQLYGTALLLEAAGLVGYRDYDASALKLAKNPEDEAAARMVSVTELGEKVMSVCKSQLPADHEDDEQSRRILDIAENRRIIVMGALTDAPHPATMLIRYLDRKRA